MGQQGSEAEALTQQEKGCRSEPLWRILAKMGNPQIASGSLFANRFEIDCVAGTGGMGTVYRARDRYSGDLVALKLLHGCVGGLGEVERFTREAQLLSELRHPGIVSHVAHGQTPDGQRFLAMEWLEGEDLSHRLVRGPLPLRQCITLIAEAADALAAAHKHGIIHRDLKPSNLFILDEEMARLKLLDFGIARRLDASHPMTQTGMVVGTPEYMAPEQARGSRDLTPAADLFSLGCILYECLTGHPPFVADHIAAVLVRILFEDPPPIEDRRPGIPESLLQLLGRLLVKDPALRLADAAALRADLFAFKEAPEPGLAVTVASSSSRQDSFAESEQSLLSVVLATSPDGIVESSSTPPEGSLGQVRAERQALLQALVALGVSAEFLANGTLLVTVSPMGSARDLAALAARAALLITARWPAATVSLATGRGALQGRTVVGEVVEQAARVLRAGSPLQATAQLGVLADALSAKLLEGRFAQTPQPGGALLLTEEKEMDASRPLLGKATPCVGRETELATLEAQFTGCIEESEARVVLFTAPPGVGKSRLRHEFLRRVAAQRPDVKVMLGRGDFMSAGAPYGILGQALRKLCEVSGGEPLPEQRRRIQECLRQNLPDVEQARVVPFLGELTGVPFPAEGLPMLQAAREDPRIMRDSIRRAFLDWLKAECQAVPLLLVFDDLQWGDGLSIGLLDEALRELRTMPLFVLALGRPEVREIFPKLWLSHSLQEIPLKGLSKRACERFAYQVLGRHVPPEVITSLVEQSAGNALFLEELIRSAAEGNTGSQPETVLAMLQARVGRFDTGPRRALSAASMFGQTFWQGGVASVLGLPRKANEVEGWLSTLTDAELIEPRSASRLSGDKEFVFRHVLARDAAYSLLTDTDQAIGHRLVGQFLEAAGEQDPLTIAEHFGRGGEKTHAARLYCRAADIATGKCAPENALRCAERGVACGAEGELFGTLRALESYSCWLLGNIERCFKSALAALPLLRPGSLAWAYSMHGACMAAPSGPPEWQQQFPGLVAHLLAVDPEVAAESVYAETVANTMAAMVCVAPIEQKQLLSVLNRLQTLCSRAESRSPTLRRHFHSARGRYLFLAAPTPWQVVQEGSETARLCWQSGDIQNHHVAAFMEGAWSELGDSDLAIAKLASYPPTEAPLVAMTSKLRLALALSSKDDSGSHKQATIYTHEALEKLGPFPLTAVLAHDCQARVLLKQGKLEEAEMEAREACRIQNFLPRYCLDAKATLIRALLEQGKAAGAISIAQDGLAAIQQGGSLGSAEVELRLTISEAFYAVNDHEQAHRELRETLHQIDLRADDIPDPFWRNSYLTRNPYCARAQQLARQWGLLS